MKAEAQATSSSKPSMGATAAPVAETPVTQTPVAQIPVAQTPVAETPVSQTPVVETPAAHSDTPAPMETGRAGDGQSWAERVKAGIDEEFQQDRPVKRCRSQSRRREQRLTLPFPLQDSEGRLASVSQLYEHARD